MRQTIRDWRMNWRSNRTLEEIATKVNPVIRGWINYYGRFYKSEMHEVLKHMNRALVRWVQCKYKKLKRHQRCATHWLGKIAKRETKMFTHWQWGITPPTG
ncbi:group II intron maturase-specific domain-containing protein [Heliorestis acidaminivorans]|nr:group II intron maturase-specific domain-containing protein [Heliorestis acidaminivorans]